MNISFFVHIFTLLLSYNFATVPQSKQDHRYHYWSIVLDLWTSVGWLERTLICDFRKLSVSHVEGIYLVRSSGAVGDISAKAVVEAYRPAVISVSY